MTENNEPTPDIDEPEMLTENARRLIDGILSGIGRRLTDELFAEAEKELGYAEVHRGLANGYESVNATPEELRELVRANWHQNQAIVHLLSALSIQMTEMR